MNVRELRRADAPEVSREMQLNFGEELALQGWDPAHFQSVIDRSFGFPAGWVLALLRAVRRPPAHLFVAEEDRRIIGTTFLFLQRSHGYIAVVMTDPAWRGRGVASTLLGRAEAACRRRRRAWAVLDVLSQNEVARRIYLKRGYRPLRVQHWLRRELGQAREAFRPTGPDVRPMAREDLGPLVDLYRDLQPPVVRRILAPERAHIAPPRYLQSIMAATSAAWCTGPRGAPTGYIRATFTTTKEAGNLGAPLFHPRAAPAERAGLLETALAWLAASGARNVVTEVPSYAVEPLAALREAGFEERLTMDTLVLELGSSSG